MTEGSDAKSNKTNKIEEVVDDDDTAAGPELPLEGEVELPDDEEGRFFGGGITNKTAEALDFIDELDKNDLNVTVITLRVVIQAS